MNKTQDWKLILNTNNYHSIFIKSDEKNDCLPLLYKNLPEISQISQFCLLLPSIQELQNRDHSQYLHKFAPLLKIFAEEKQQKTLITEQSVLNVLIKEEKRTNFFKFLAKQKKNIVIFCSDNFEKYVENFPSDYKYLVMNFEQWEQSTEMFDRFADIKTAIARTHNPFKNPIEAFKQFS